MSASAPSPLFNLVREDTMETTLGLNYNSGSDEQDFFDEVCLKNPDGEAACHTVNQAYVDKDVRYEYIDGSIGRSSRILRHRISVDVDYVGDDVRRKLLMWMQERARVLFTPGYGASTELAYRMPSRQYMSDLGSPVHKDMTGRWTTVFAGPSGTDHAHTWDNIMHKGYMQQDWEQWGRYINTPGGHGGVHEGQIENIAVASSPVGTTHPGQTCWEKTAGLSMAYEANGFGYEPSCEGALRITDAASTSGQSVYYNFTSEIPGGTALRVNVSVWLRGNPGQNAYLQLNLSGENRNIPLTDLDMGDWTRVTAVLYRASVSAALLSIHCPLGNVVDDNGVDFLIGPVCITIHESGWKCTTPNWAKDGAGRSQSDQVYIANFKYPKRGSIFSSVYFPADFPANSYDRHDAAHICSLIIPSTGSSGRFGFFKHPNYNEQLWTAFYMNTGGTAVRTQGLTHNWIIGGVNVVAATWVPGSVKIYINGKLIATRNDMSDFSELTVPETHYMYGTDNYGTWPIIPLHMRIDRELFDDTQVANISAAMQNPGALEVVIPARGRIYRITGVPSTPRSAQRTTHWLGRLELEQVDYNYQWADETTKENF